MRPTFPLRTRAGAGPARRGARVFTILFAIAVGALAGVARDAAAQDGSSQGGGARDARVALILAAETYETYGRSEAGLAEARALAAGFEALDFDVRLVEDASDASARAALRAFAPMAADADFAIIVAVGHSAAGRGGSFFLPANAELRRSSDLLTRGVAATALAQIVAQANVGAVFMLTGAAETPATLQGVGAHPAYPTPPAEDVVVVFSGSTRIPVSQLGGVARAAARRLATALSAETPPTLAALIEAAAAESRGLVVGAAVYDFAPPPSAPEASAEPETNELSEPTAPVAETETETAAETEPLGEPEQAAGVDQETVAGGSGDATEDAYSALDGGAPQAGAGDEEAGAREVDIEELLRIERLLGPAQVRGLQRALAEDGHYAGRVDGVIGPVTRAAISAFQAARGEDETGYLTLDQIDALLR